jgi:beta-glucosidase
MKAIFKYKNSRAWFIVTAIVLALMITINVVGGVVFYDLLCIVLGKGTPVYADDDTSTAAYESDYYNKSDALTKSNQLNIEFNEEGIVMLKNEDSALPLSSGAKVSVFGKNSVNLVYGGSGSGGTSSDGAKTLYDSLTEAGFTYNTELKKFYDSSDSGSGRADNPSMNSAAIPGLATGETPVNKYTDKLKSSYSNYNDAALIVFSRIGGEGADLPRTMATEVGGSTAVDGARSASDHYLQLDQNETDLIKYVSNQGFKHIIVIINSNSAMELGFLDDPTNYAYSSKIDGCLWIGSPGKTGIMALGEVLNGSVNPSGHLVDTYARDLKQSPTWNNFGNNNVKNGDSYLVDGKTQQYYYVDYEEGIYVGYRYYETRGYTDGETWYNNNVVFPFGYGLSYTTFQYEIVDKSSLPTVMDKSEITVKVRVTNTGSVAGKAVVQLYATAPYTEGGIEKAYKVLCGFEKTSLLAAGASEEVTITIDPYTIASYDYNDANKNGFSGYELEAGAYTFSVSTDAHNAVETFSCTVAQSIKYETDTTTGTKIENLFEDTDDQLGTTLSRADWDGTWPQTRSDSERTVEKSFITSLSDYSAYIAAMPAVDTSEVGVDHSTGSNGEDYSNITLRDLVNVDIDDERWEALLDRLSYDDMVNLFNKGAFQTIALLNISKPATLDTDGPVGWTNFMDQTGTYNNTCSYASECLLGSTWNKDILYAMGESVGNEALIGSGGTPYTTWYAPAVNIHRSAFGGRNFEYFSEDGYFSGVMATYEIKGAMSKGVNPTIKHFALNEQETHRSSNGVLTWATEQSMRELYLKPFEIAVKQAGVRGIMSSFNRVGTIWAGGDYNLLTKLLKEEWGFNGMIISDYNDGTPYMDCKQMAYAGGNLDLASRQDYYWTSFSSNSVEDKAVIRRNTKSLLYSIANSNALNKEVLRYNLPLWMDIMFVVDAAIVVGLGVWGFFAIRSSLKKEKAKAAQPQTETTA